MGLGGSPKTRCPSDQCDQHSGGLLVVAAFIHGPIHLQHRRSMIQVEERKPSSGNQCCLQVQSQEVGFRTLRTLHLGQRTLGGWGVRQPSRTRKMPLNQKLLSLVMRKHFHQALDKTMSNHHSSPPKARDTWKVWRRKPTHLVPRSSPSSNPFRLPWRHAKKDLRPNSDGTLRPKALPWTPPRPTSQWAPGSGRSRIPPQ